MKSTKLKPSSKPTTTPPALALSVDLLRAVVGGRANPKEEEKK